MTTWPVYNTTLYYIFYYKQKPLREETYNDEEEEDDDDDDDEGGDLSKYNLDDEVHVLLSEKNRNVPTTLTSGTLSSVTPPSVWLPNILGWAEALVRFRMHGSLPYEIIWYQVGTILLSSYLPTLLVFAGVSKFLVKSPS